MLNQVHFQIVSKIASTLITTRHHPQRPFFQQLQDNLQLHRTHPHHSLHALLQSLLPPDHHHLLEKIVKHAPQGRMSSNASVQVIFSLIEKTSGYRREVEVWEISATRNKIGDSGQSTGLLADFITQITLLLSRLPLLTVYRKEKQLKNAYVLDYKCHYQHPKTPSLFSLQAQHYLHRKDDSLTLLARVAYCPSLSFLIHDKPLKPAFSPQSKRKHSLASSDYGGDSKVSVYVFYDKDLDFTFLSSEEQAEGGSEEFKTELTMQEVSSEFELLICEEDVEFWQKNQDLFETLASRENQLLI